MPDVLVIGAGIGGLAVSAQLAREGRRVMVLEAHSRPGGCSASFHRAGFRFEAGATVGCGFHPGGPLDDLARRIGITWPVEPAAVSWEYRHRDRRIPLARNRTALLAAFPETRPFWSEQERLADLVWDMARKDLPWPPHGPGDLLSLAGLFASGLPGSLVLPRFLFSTVRDWLGRHGLLGNRDFVRFLDAGLLISAQTTSCHVNALYGAIALDLPRKGTHHVTGGMGMVAKTLAGALTRLGGEIRLRSRVRGIRHDGKKVAGVVTDAGDVYSAPVVIANLTHHSLERILDGPAVSIECSPHSARVPLHGAFILHMGVRQEVFRGCDALHFHLVGDGPDLTEGGSAFLSLAAVDDPHAAPSGTRAVTASTHTAPERWWRALENGKGDYATLKDGMARRVFDLASRHFPGFREGIVHCSAGTPVTYERFTGRHRGYVGGYPQCSLLRAAGPRTSLENLFVVGDSVFPGQSAAGVVTGAARLASLLSGH